MPSTRLTTTQKDLVDKLLYDSQERAKGGDNKAARVLLVLALDVAAGHPEILVRAGEVRGLIKDEPKASPAKLTIPEVSITGGVTLPAFPAADLSQSSQATQYRYGPPDEESTPDETGDIDSIDNMDNINNSDARTSSKKNGEFVETGIRNSGSYVADNSNINSDRKHNYGSYKERGGDGDTTKEKKSYATTVLLLLLILGAGGYWFTGSPYGEQWRVYKTAYEADRAWKGGHLEEASDLASQVLENYPERYDMQVIVARAEVASGSHTTAKLALARVDGMSETWQDDMEIARMWVKIKEPEKAADAYFRAFTRGGGEVAKWQDEILAAQVKAGQIERASRIRVLLQPATVDSPNTSNSRKK